MRDREPVSELSQPFSVDDLEIREMELEDLPAVFALGESLFTADRWPTLYRTWDEYELVGLFSSDSDFCFVADFEGRVIGFAVGTLIEKRRSAWKYGWLLWLGTDPRYRRLGVAKRLVDRFTEQCIDEGARMMLVDTAADNRGAIRFFEKEGYGKAERHVYMSKNLTNMRSYRRRRKEQ